jgi:allantoate deiminase
VKAALAGKIKQAVHDCDALAAQALHRCAELALATDDRGQILRTFLSPAMEDCHRRVREWMEFARMTVAVDRVGNIRGYYAAAQEPAARLIIASHLDTVPNAGKYDGILGVVLGIALVDALRGRELRFGIEVIGFSDEEGVRYGLPFIGSRAVIGQLGPPQLARPDGNGVRMATAIAAYGAAHPEAIETPLDPRARGYLEFHIEQGPVLEEAGLVLGVVETIAGQSRCSVTFRGRAGHAGTTPMSLRRDALAAAAEWLVAVESAALAVPGLVATAGKIICEPGAPNVIPGMVRLSLDVRHADDSVRRGAVESMLVSAESIASHRRIEVEHCIEYDQAAVALDEKLTALAEAALSEAGIPPKRMTSGAGHDAMIVASRVPAAMIFLRSPGGISHHPDEAVLAEDVAAALRAGLNFLNHFDRSTESEPSRA